jgi:uncharacterized protein (DUF305 family)
MKRIVTISCLFATAMGAQLALSPKDFMHAMHVGMKAMDHDMATAPMSGNVDHDFATMMIPHHQGAVDMAKAELIYGTDPVMRRLAQEIIVDQQSEIEAMHLWLDKTTIATAKGEK